MEYLSHKKIKMFSMKLEKRFTLEEVAQHNKKDDAWIVIDGIVYDVTKFSAFHPGGTNIILEHKGTDATKVFWGIEKKLIIIFLRSSS